MDFNKIRYVEKIVPDAYHGTSKENAGKILEEGFHLSTGDGQFLGDGVYFFESSELSAWVWTRRNRIKPNKAVVFKAVVNLGKCLDLHNPEHLTIITETRDSLFEQIEDRKDSELAEDYKLTDALVINFLANICGLDSVRVTYYQPNSPLVFEESKFNSYSQLIICIRNTDNILSYEIIEKKL